MSHFLANFGNLINLLRDHARQESTIDDKESVAAREASFIRVIPLEEVAATGYYSDMAELAPIFNHEIIEVKGTPGSPIWRWRPNGIVHFAVHSGECGMHEGEWLGHMKARYFRGCINMNDLWTDFYKGRFTCEELMKFYMGLGYSLGGYIEIFGQKEATEMLLFDARKRTAEDDEDSYVQTPIMYMIEKYKGQVLKI